MFICKHDCATIYYRPCFKGLKFLVFSSVGRKQAHGPPAAIPVLLAVGFKKKKAKNCLNDVEIEKNGILRNKCYSLIEYFKRNWW